MDYTPSLHEELFLDSLVGAGPGVHAVWAYALTTMERTSHWCPEARYVVDLNPIPISTMIGMTAGEVEAAINRLCARDEYARRPNEGGCRLVRLNKEFARVGPTLYRVVNGDAIERLSVVNARRLYMRVLKREQRARDAAAVAK